MTHLVNETFGQARKGSVAAIIQVLNERLADAGIRVRAVVAEGVLQLLCEAATPDQLDQAQVVERVRNILEQISPQGFRRVKINSRIVKEEQLLWLEEINRDPENTLLWTETITLKQPFFVQRWLRDRHLKSSPLFKGIPHPVPAESSLAGKILGASLLVLLLGATAWLFRDDLRQISSETARSSSPPLPAVPDNRASDSAPLSAPPSAPSSEASSPGTPTASSPTSRAEGAFAEAVQIAEKAAQDGQSATTAADWLDLAARWQKASDLMAQIPADNERYAIAQDRIQAYRANSEAALKKADAAR